MAKKDLKPESNPDLAFLHLKVDAILALLLRQLSDEAVGKWGNQDKPNIVCLLIDLGLDNTEISKIVGLTYNSVANIRSKNKKGKLK